MNTTFTIVDYFPTPIGDVLSVAAALLVSLAIALLALWRGQSRKLHIAGLVVVALVGIADILLAWFLVRHGIAWRGRQFAPRTSQDDVWFVSRAADFCFLAAWSTATALLVRLMKSLARMGRA